MSLALYQCDALFHSNQYDNIRQTHWPMGTRHCCEWLEIHRTPAFLKIWFQYVITLPVWSSLGLLKAVNMTVFST